MSGLPDNDGSQRQNRRSGAFLVSDVDSALQDAISRFSAYVDYETQAAAFERLASECAREAREFRKLAAEAQ